MTLRAKARHTVGRVLGRPAFEGSSSFWKERYERGGNSGGGSFGRLARQKADFLNALVSERDLETVLEIGCGDGNQLALAEYPSYTGIDVSPAAITACRERFGDDSTKRFLVAGEGPLPTCELGLSLDVIYHLVEDPVFERYMDDLLGHSAKCVVLYTSDSDRHVSDRVEPPHVRHRPIQRWMEGRLDWSLSRHVPNAYPYDATHQTDTSSADFFVYDRVRGSTSSTAAVS